MLREEIEKAAKKHKIKAGVLLSAVGSLQKAVLRMAGATPDKQVVKEFVGPLEIVSGTGTVSQTGCHLHISVSDPAGRVWGGHLKGGCVVDSTAEIVICVIECVSYSRVLDPTTGFSELDIKASS